MVWSIELGRKAARQLEELDAQIARRILQFLNHRVAALENPRSIGEALKGTEFGDLWKYRVGTIALSPASKTNLFASWSSALGTGERFIADRTFAPSRFPGS